ncbi:MAG: aminomethyltransferase family protein [Natronomonas sp.]
MTAVEEIHEDHGGRFVDRGGRRFVSHYRRPERVHQAVRNGAGVIEMDYDVLEVGGDDRVEFVDNAVSNRIPDDEGQGVYALLLDPQGHIEVDLYVFDAGTYLLCFVPPGRAKPLADEWREKTFIQDVEFSVTTGDIAIFGVHGPKSTEKVASVLTGPSTPEKPISFVRGEIGDWGVTVIRTDDLAGEEGYDVVCRAEDAPGVFDALLTRGYNAVPFGHRTYDALTLEAGTPSFDAELEGIIPNVAGVRNALDFEKGCYVGQEVVSRIENRGRPPQRLVGLEIDGVPDSGASVSNDDEHVGDITRAVDSPIVGAPIALAYIDYGSDETEFGVRIDGDEVSARRVELPFVDGSAKSRRLPQY